MDLPIEHGSTAVIMRVLAANGGIPMDRKDQYREALHQISLDEFLRALIADVDAEEIITLLVLNKDIEVVGKPVKKIIVVADDGTETVYREDV